MSVFSTLRLLLAVFACTAMLLAPSAGHALDGAKKADLQKALADFDRAIRSNDFSFVARNSLPPRLLNFMAKNAGVTPETLRENVIRMTVQVTAEVKTESFKFEFDAAKFKELPGGVPYVLIPTVTVMMANGQRVVGKSYTLAFIEDGRWYLLRINDTKQANAIQKAYPEFQDVDFPRGSMEIVSK